MQGQQWMALLRARGGMLIIWYASVTLQDFFGSTVRPSAYFQLQKCFIHENLLMMIPAAWNLPCLNLISGALQSAA